MSSRYTTVIVARCMVFMCIAVLLFCKIRRRLLGFVSSVRQKRRKERRGGWIKKMR